MRKRFWAVMALVLGTAISLSGGSARADHEFNGYDSYGGGYRTSCDTGRGYRTRARYGDEYYPNNYAYNGRDYGGYG
jgi:hypothetical protein